ncbi:MAG: glycosyltransferase family 39 protein, partial [Bacteroidia bacterium]|nr:glycosyltransferase family 39 protein [Bacteroidia bacterium]
MPFMSVRFLVETVALPLVLAGTWFVLRACDDDRPRLWLWAGFLMGLSFAIRYQTVLIIGGTGLALLWMQRLRGATFFALGAAAGMLLLQGAVDAYFWKIPFAPLYYYYKYNVEHAADYPVLPWYNYLLLFAGVFVPPMSLFLLFGAVRDWRKHLPVFLPTFVFFAFHSYHINKQERFVLTIVPQVLILGATGWEKFREGSEFWNRRPKLYPRLTTLFWTLNAVALVPLSFSSSKLHAVDTMRFLGSRPENERYAVIFDSYKKNRIFVPDFYMGKNKRLPVQIEFKADETPEQLRQRLGSLTDSIYYVLVFQDVDLPLREARLKRIFPELRRDTVIRPALLDQIMYALNPVNLNQTVYVYRTRPDERRAPARDMGRF